MDSQPVIIGRVEADAVKQLFLGLGREKAWLELHDLHWRVISGLAAP
jgi:hypothetical protein